MASPRKNGSTVQEIYEKREWDQNKRELDELPNTEIVKSSIRLASGGFMSANHRIIDHRMENYGAYIVFISK